MSQLKTNLQEILAEKQQKLVAENIRRNVSVFGVVGTLDEGIDTSDATAVSDDLAEGKTAYANNEKITGILRVIKDNQIGCPTIEQQEQLRDDQSNIILDDINSLLVLRSINSGRFIFDNNIMRMMIKQPILANAIGLSADKIAQGNTILGIAGTVVPEDPEHADYDDCLQLTEEILGNV